MSRPSSYDPKYIEELFRYFNQPPYIEKGNREVATDFPTVASFAIKVGVSRKTLYAWAKEFPEFGEAMEWPKLFQERYLTVNGLKGLITPAMAIFTAKNCIGYRDKQPDEVPDTQVIVNTIGDWDETKEKRLKELLAKQAPK